jgi:hypothetical protein
VLEVLGGAGVLGTMARDVFKYFVMGFWVLAREVGTFWLLQQVKKRYK